MVRGGWLSACRAEHHTLPLFRSFSFSFRQIPLLIHITLIHIFDAPDGTAVPGSALALQSRCSNHTALPIAPKTTRQVHHFQCRTTLEVHHRPLPDHP